MTTSGGVPLYIDQWESISYIEAVKSVLGCCPAWPPHGRASGTHGAGQSVTAGGKLVSRFDTAGQLVGNEPAYHHTAWISMNYALLVGLELLRAEGLQAPWERRRANAQLLWQGLQALGLVLVGAPENRLLPLTSV